MKYTLTEGQSFDPEILRQELVVAIGESTEILFDGSTRQRWMLSTGGSQVDFKIHPELLDIPTVGPVMMDAGEVVILTHFDNGAAREQAKLRQQIKGIRETALERFTKNSGVSQVYSLNYEAAMLGATDTTTLLRTGKTPAQHLEAKGSRFLSADFPAGMTAEQFATYIINENRGTDPYTAGAIKMDEIEDEYLTAVTTPTVTEQMVAAYQAFCDARTA